MLTDASLDFVALPFVSPVLECASVVDDDGLRGASIQGRMPPRNGLLPNIKIFAQLAGRSRPFSGRSLVLAEGWPMPQCGHSAN